MEKSYTLRNITCETSNKLCNSAIKKAKELGIKINVSVVDKSGLEMAFLRMEDSFIHSISISKDKAYTSASFGFPTAKWSEIFKNRPHLEQGFSNRDRLVPFGGGFPIFKNDELIGAIGVSGGSEDEDAVCAQAAIDKILGD